MGLWTAFKWGLSWIQPQSLNVVDEALIQRQANRREKLQHSRLSSRRHTSQAIVKEDHPSEDKVRLKPQDPSNDDDSNKQETGSKLSGALVMLYRMTCMWFVVTTVSSVVLSLPLSLLGVPFVIGIGVTGIVSAFIVKLWLRLLLNVLAALKTVVFSPSLLLEMASNAFRKVVDLPISWIKTNNNNNEDCVATDALYHHQTQQTQHYALQDSVEYPQYSSVANRVHSASSTRSDMTASRQGFNRYPMHSADHFHPMHQYFQSRTDSGLPLDDSPFRRSSISSVLKDNVEQAPASQYAYGGKHTMAYSMSPSSPLLYPRTPKVQLAGVFYRELSINDLQRLSICSHLYSTSTGTPLNKVELLLGDTPDGNTHSILSLWNEFDSLAPMPNNQLASEAKRNEQLDFSNLIGFVEYFSKTHESAASIWIEKFVISNLYADHGFSKRLLRKLQHTEGINSISVWSLWHSEPFFKSLGFRSVYTPNSPVASSTVSETSTLAQATSQISMSGRSLGDSVTMTRGADIHSPSSGTTLHSSRSTLTDSVIPVGTLNHAPCTDTAAYTKKRANLGVSTWKRGHLRRTEGELGPLLCWKKSYDRYRRNSNTSLASSIE